jgi:hypothetical protein
VGESGYNIADKMCTLITGQTMRATKPSDDILKNKPGHCICREISDRFFFSPTGEIVGIIDDIPFFQVLGWWIDQSYEVNCPFLKGLKSLNICNGNSSLHNGLPTL